MLKIGLPALRRRETSYYFTRKEDVRSSVGNYWFCLENITLIIFKVLLDRGRIVILFGS